jgi:hypothetical protein
MSNVVRFFFNFQRLVIFFASFRNERLQRSWWHLTGEPDDVRVDRKAGPCACEVRAGLGWTPCVGHHKLEIGGAAMIRLESLSAAFRLELTSVESGH